MWSVYSVGRTQGGDSGYNRPPIFTGIIAQRPETFCGRCPSLGPVTMKNDPTFKLVAAVILAGVFLALFSPDSTSGSGRAVKSLSVRTVAEARVH